MATTRDLPEDIWASILRKLPVKSLLRFRCVSNSWLSLIDDPLFVCSHFHRFNNESNLLFIEKYQTPSLSYPREPVVRCSQSLEKRNPGLGFLCNQPPDSLGTLITSPAHARRVHSNYELEVIYSVDGLFMLKTYDGGLMVWNPSIRKTLILPTNTRLSSKGMKNFQFGLGFDSVSKDYKHVSVGVNFDKDECFFVSIYTLGTNSWKTIDFPGEGRSRFYWHCYFDYKYSNRRVLYMYQGTRGVLYVLVRYEPKEFISFDLSNEVFASIQLPVFNIVEAPQWGSLWRLYYQALTMADGKTSLALIHFSQPNASVWVLETSEGGNKSLGWTQLYAFSPSLIFSQDALSRFGEYFLYLTKNGEMLVKWGANVKSQHLETHKEKILLEKMEEIAVCKVWPYMENLYRFN